MVEYLKKEKDLINWYKRGLITFGEVSNRLYGYLECMVDVGILSEDRMHEEYSISVKRIIDSVF